MPKGIISGNVARHFSLGRSRWSLEGGLRLAAGDARSARGISKLPPTAPGWRSWAFAGLLLGAALGMSAFLRPSPPPRVPPLEEFPMSLGPWQGSATPLPPATLEALDLHDYLNRVYFGRDQQVVGLYIAYYPQQTFGDDIHSPKNCLPGSGWEPLQSGSMSLAGAWPGRTEPMTVNSYLVARGNQRELILYWYQQQGRAIRSEYWSKFYQVWDGLRRRRSDAALVRVAIPMDGDRARAAARGAAFIRLVTPRLPEFIPD